MYKACGLGLGDYDNTTTSSLRSQERPKGLLRTVFVAGMADEMAGDLVIALLR